MKKILFITLLGLVSTYDTFAQEAPTTRQDTGDVAAQDYERMLEAQLQMDFRSYAIKNLNLTEDEIIAFDPLFREYMNAKDDIIQRKFNVLEKFSQDEKDENTQSGKENELGDAIEDFWQADIAEMELQKDYFDRLEDKIDPEKALQFFLMENAVQTRIHELKVVEVMPMIIEMERMPGREYGSYIQGDTTGNMSRNNMYRDTTGNMNDMNRNNINRDTPGSMNNQDMNRNNINRDTTGSMNNQDMNRYNNNNNTNNTYQDTTGIMNRNNSHNTTGVPNTTTPRTPMNENDRMNNTSTNTTNSSADYMVITSYDTWYNNEGASIGKVDADLDHQDIYNGLTKLMDAIEAIANATNAEMANMKTQKSQVMNLLNRLQRNRMTDKHSDEAREAFTITANMINTLQNSTNASGDAAQEAARAAQSLNTNQLLIRQLDKVNDFFRHAQTAVNNMAQSVQWTNNNRD